MELSHLATWYAIGFFISFIMVIIGYDNVDDRNHNWWDNIILSIFSWLFVIFSIIVFFKELTDNRK